MSEGDSKLFHQPWCGVQSDGECTCPNGVYDRGRAIVWVGVIFDPYGDWVYVGATKEALFYDMRTNYGEIEFRDESDWDWEKRLVNSGARLDVDSYYIATEEGAE